MCNGAGSTTNCESLLCPHRRRLELDLFRGYCPAASAELLDTFRHIPIGRILPPDPAIGFQRFCNSAQRFQRATQHIEDLDGFLGRAGCGLERLLKCRDGILIAAG